MKTMGDSWKQPFGGRTDDDDAVNPPGKGKEEPGKMTTNKGDQHETTRTAIQYPYDLEEGSETFCSV